MSKVNLKIHLHSMLLLTLVSILLISKVQANDNSFSVSEVLTASLNNTQQSISRRDQQPIESFQSSSWLAAFPSIGLNYLDSQDVIGGKEQEISLNLPLKSPFLRQTTEQLSQLNQQAKVIQQQRRRLYFSGLLRETFWSYRLLEIEIKQANKKSTLLDKLYQEYHALFQASEVEHYALLLIEQELSSQKLAISSLQLKQQQWQQRYTNISGLQMFPSTIIEEAVLEGNLELSEHPEIRKLDNHWKQLKLAFNSQGRGENEPWTVSFASKTVNNGLFEENQLGINFEIPLTFSQSHRQADINSHTNANAEYYANLDRTRIELYSRWQDLKTEQNTLHQQQALLAKSAELSENIARQLDALHGDGEISHETWLRRYLQTIDSQTNLAIGKLKFNQIQSMLNQAAGISL